MYNNNRMVIKKESKIGESLSIYHIDFEMRRCDAIRSRKMRKKNQEEYINYVNKRTVIFESHSDLIRSLKL